MLARLSQGWSGVRVGQVARTACRPSATDRDQADIRAAVASNARSSSTPAPLCTGAPSFALPPTRKLRRFRANGLEGGGPQPPSYLPAASSSLVVWVRRPLGRTGSVILVEVERSVAELVGIVQPDAG
jgi:hypothetical protein